MNRFILGITLLFIFLSGFTACKTGKKAAHNKVAADTTIRSKPTDTSAIAIAPVTHISSTDKKLLIDSIGLLWQKHFTYKTFVGKAKMHYDGGGTNQEFTANFRVKKDSVIWIAITALGGMVQVARIYITPDSFYMVNYIQKEAYCMTIGQAAKLLPVPVGFSTLQNIVTGEAPGSGGNITDAADMAGVWSIQVEDSSYTQQITYNKTDSTMRSGTLRTRGARGILGAIQYDNYTVIDGQRFSMDRNINIQNGGEQYTLDMSFINANFDQPLEYPFSIPRNYNVK
jgi:hypothetical protein